MNINVITIGNSKGIRIPKKILDKCDIGDSVKLSVKGHSIVLMPVTKKPREGWNSAAKEMRKKADDYLLVKWTPEKAVG